MAKISFSSNKIENTDNKATSFVIGGGANSDAKYPSTRAVNNAVINYIDSLLADMDYVTNTSTVDGWTVEYYRSGKIVARIKKTCSGVDISKVWGSGYASTSTYTVAAPSGVFTNIKHKEVYAEVNKGGYVIYLLPVYNSTGVSMQFGRHTNPNEALSVDAYITLIGD